MAPFDNDLSRQFGIESNARTYSRTINCNIVRGQGSLLFDEQGHRYIDCLAGAGTLATGHNHPEIVSCLTSFLTSGQILHGLDMVTPAKRIFSEKVIAAFPEQWRNDLKIQFCGPTGADAAEAAIKLFKTATGRSNIIAFHGAYHGMTCGALSMTGNLKVKDPIQGLMPGVHFLPYPYLFRSPYGVGAEETIDISLHHIRQTLVDPESGISKPAAMIVEAIQGEGGCIPAPLRWLKGLREICTELDIPLILDEVQSGIGRSGAMFAFELADIQPDAVLLSKAIGGGLPMSLLVYHQKYDRWAPGAHTGTFRGNQLAMIAGTATLEIIEREQILEQTKLKGAVLMHMLEGLKARHASVGDVRGTGLMVGIELVDIRGKSDKFGRFPPNGDLATRVKRRCFEHGLIVETGGRHGAVVRLLPALTIETALLEEAVCILDQALGDER